MRQILSDAITLNRPDVLTKYYELDDGLLIALLYKNPPDRLLRNQWTYPINTIPDLETWKRFVKDDTA
jgi:hypothetical protein